MHTPNLIFVGPSGVGKSLIGAQVAKKLKRIFFDVDSDIEKHCGIDISWIFDQEGEGGFRERELEALKRGLDLHQPVIATGAGIVTTPECVTLLAQPRNFIVFLDAPATLLDARLARAKNRPLLQGKTGTARHQKIAEMRKQRTPIYQQLAHYRVHCSRKLPHQLVEDIVRHVSS